MNHIHPNTLFQSAVVYLDAKYLLFAELLRIRLITARIAGSSLFFCLFEKYVCSLPRTIHSIGSHAGNLPLVVYLK
jgi:hypothetical protein